MKTFSPFPASALDSGPFSSARFGSVLRGSALRDSAPIASVLLALPIFALFLCPDVTAAGGPIAGGAIAEGAIAGGPIAGGPMRGAPGVPAAPPIARASIVTGTVLETMSAAGYTYVQVDADGEKVWAAGPTTSVAVGETISFSRGMTMNNFTSKALDRTFETIYFVEAIYKGDVAAAPATGHGGSQGAPAAPHPGLSKPTGGRPNPHAGVMGGQSPSEPEITGIEKAEGGKTVAEVFEQAAELSGTEVAVRGKVVKANAAVMGKNWLHLRDGSKAASGADDLTVTTQAAASVGDTVVVRGMLRTDVDLGYGYHYEVIVEEAEITVE